MERVINLRLMRRRLGRRKIVGCGMRAALLSFPELDTLENEINIRMKLSATGTITIA